MLGAVEFAIRWRVEHGFVAACRSFLTSAAPFSSLRTGDWVVPDPDLGYRLGPALRGVNSLGIRNAEIPAAKSPGVPRVIVLGDSVAWPSDGFVTMVRQRLGGATEVINAAIPGYTTYQERRLFERDLLRTKPDLVLLQYSLNDNHKFLHRFETGDRMLITEQARRALLPTEGGLRAFLTRHSYLAFRVRLALLELRAAGGSYPWQNEPDVAVAWQDDPWKQFAEHLAAMHAELRPLGARLVVVMVPYRPQFDARLLARDRSYVLKPQRMMAQICAAQGVPLLDLYPVMAQHGGPTLFVDNYHFSRAGHHVVAEALLHFLHAQGLLL
ncbi:MAG: SGNH/GDSL hydrolase family protein [Acidobacteria bacterium]|nr:SGNH/GDSL hydrolase family protein [Acidobacteriota bacterium]